MAKKNYFEFTQSQLPFTDTFDDDLLIRDYFFVNNEVGAPILSSGELFFDIASPDTNNYDSRIRYGAKVYGSFDIQFDIRFVPVSNNTTYTRNLFSYFELYDNVDNYQGRGDLYRRESDTVTSRFQGQLFNASFGTIFSNSVVPTSDVNDNTLRITYDSGTDTMSFYYLDGTWQLITSGITGLVFDYTIPYIGGSAIDSSYDGYYDNFQINSADDVKWTYVFNDKFNEGTAGSSVTAVNFSIPYVDNFTTDPFLETYNYTCSDYNYFAFNGFVTYSEANDRMEFDYTWPPGVNTGYWYHRNDFRFSGNCECEWEYTFGPSISAFGTTGIEVKAESPSNLNAVRFYVGQSDGRVFRRYRINGGGWILNSTGLQISANDTYGFRLRRTGHVVIFEYSKNGGAWTEPTTGRYDFTSQIGVGDYSLDDWHFYTYMGTWSAHTAAVSWSYNSFKINSASPLPEYVPAKTVPAVPVDVTENWWTNRPDGTDTMTQEGALVTQYGSNSIDRSSGVIGATKLSGDFDIQVDYDIDTLLPPTVIASYAILFRVWDTTDSVIANITRGVSSDPIDRYSANGTDLSTTNVTTSDITGKLRITRVSGEIRVYYWNSTQWEWNGDTNGIVAVNNTTDVVYIDIAQGQRAGSTVLAYISNFVINSCDRIVWAGGTLKRFFPYTSKTKFTDTFTDTDGSSPNPTLWTGTAIIQNNKLRHFLSTSTQAQQSIFELQGDFSVQTDFDKLATPATATYHMHLKLDLGNGNDYLQIVSGYIGSNYSIFVQSYIGTTLTNETTLVGTVVHTGKFRFVRVGNIITPGYHNGTSWTDTDTFNYGSAPDVTCILGVFTNGPNVGCDFDNFIINSADSVAWNGGGEWTPSYMNRYDTGAWTDAILNNHIEYTDVAPWTEDFIGTNGDDIDTNIWSANSQVTIQSNTAQMYYAGSGIRPNIVSKFYVSGDFDIETDISSTGMVGLAGDEQDLSFRVTSVSSGEYVQIQVNNKSTDQIVAEHSADTDYTVTTWTDPDISFRITRVGTLIRLYYKTNASGTWIAVPDYSYNLSGDVTITFPFWYGTASTTEWTGDIDSVTVNSGTIVWNGIGEFQYVGNV